METKANEESKNFCQPFPFFALCRSLIFIGHVYFAFWADWAEKQLNEHFVSFI